MSCVITLEDDDDDEPVGWFSATHEAAPTRFSTKTEAGNFKNRIKLRYMLRSYRQRF